MSETEQTSGMIALVPDVETARQLALPDGVPVGELHLTLVYLGDDVSGMTGADHSELVHQVQSAAVRTAPVLGRVFSHAVYNPDGYADRTPCAVYQVGDCPELVALYETLKPIAPVPQHSPYFPHITAGVGEFFGAGDLPYTGPVLFDRIRLALGGVVVDVPLTGEPGEGLGQKSAQPDGTPHAQFAAGLRLGLDGLDPHETAVLEAELVEVKAGPPGATYPSQDPRAARLRHYWTRTPEGLAKWRPGQPGAFKRLVKHLRKHVGAQAEGLAAIYYRAARGFWPGKNRGRGKSADLLTVHALHLGVVRALRPGLQTKTGDPEELDELDDEWADDEAELDEDFEAEQADLFSSLAEHEERADRITTGEAWDEAEEADVQWSPDMDGTLRRDGETAAAPGPVDTGELESMLDEYDQGPDGTVEPPVKRSVR